MPEKPPQFERPPVRVVGKSSEETKEKLRQKIAGRFREELSVSFSGSTIEKFKSLEYDKRPYELEFITAANTKINELREKYGLQPFQVSPEKFHIVPQGLLKEAGYSTDFVGLQDSNRQIIVANAELLRHSKVGTGRSILHEITHLMGYVAFEALDEDSEAEEKETDNKGAKKPDSDNDNTNKKDTRWIWSVYRMGLMTFSTTRKFDKDDDHESFRGLNEAIVSEIEDMYSGGVIDDSNDPEVMKELAWIRSDEALEIKKRISKEKNIPENEITWVNKNQKSAITATEKTYRLQRKVLHFLVEEMAEDTDKSTGEIIDMFFRAHFTGNLIDLARIINKTFEDDLAFRTIGMMGSEPKDGRQMLDYLKKKRALIKKKRNKENAKEN